MRILYVRNGPYEVNLNLYNLQEIGFCRALCDKGHDCDIVYYSKKPNKVETIYKSNMNSRVNIIWSRGWKILRTGIYPSLLKRKFVNRYDLIVTTEYSQIMTLFWTFFKPKVVLYNGPYYNLFKIPFTEKIYDRLFVKQINKRVAKTFTKSSLASTYLEQKGMTNTKVLGVGLNFSVFTDSYLPPDLKYLTTLKKNNKILLYIGSLDERKNFPFLLKVFENINKSKSDTKLIIVGKGKKNYIASNFNRIDENTRKNIIHIPVLENKLLKNLYELADIFVLPSKYEIFGMVLLESMAFGTPVVSSLNGGSSTLIENGSNGIILSEFDIDLWQKNILNLLEDDQKREEMGQSSKNKIREHFNWHSISEEFLKQI